MEPNQTKKLLHNKGNHKEKKKKKEKKDKQWNGRKDLLMMLPTRA